MGTCEDIYREHTELIEEAARTAGVSEPTVSWLAVLGKKYGRGEIDAATLGDMNTFRANGCSIPPDGINQGPPATAESIQIENVTAASERPNGVTVAAVVSLPQSVSESVSAVAEGRLDGEVMERLPILLRPGDTVDLEWVLTDVTSGQREFCVEIVEG